MDDLYPPQTVAAGLAALARRWPDVQSTSREEPVFVLAAGWRSGSTLLQRALLSQCLVWGEPLGHAGLIERLADPLRAVNDHWPEPHFVYRGQPVDSLAGKFIANLYPQPRHWMEALLAWFDALFARPARAAGRGRWGLKEVRLSADHATLLRWLYPRAKLLFLIRNPYDAFRSFAARRDQGWKWYHRWPDYPVTPELFGRHWRELAGSFLAAGEALGGLVIHYEDLEGGGWKQVRDYVGFELNDKAIRTNPPDGGPRPVATLSASDYEPLRDAVEPLASELGYEAGQKSGSRKAGVLAVSPQVEGPKSQVKAPTPNISAPSPSLPVSPSPPLPLSPSPAVPVSRPAFRPSPSSHCAVLVPVADRIEPACEAALRELERRGYRVVRTYGYRQIDLARNQMASDALAAGCHETLWIDADMGFDPDAVEQLRASDAPIVSGIYPKKGKRELAIHVLPGTAEIVFGSGGGLVEVLYAPTGFLLVRRTVYETMERELALPRCLADTGRTLVPYFAPLVRPDGDGWWYLAEDFAFCERARQCGFRILADSRLRLWHIGSFAYGWEQAGRTPPRYANYRFHLTGAAPQTPPSPERSPASKGETASSNGVGVHPGG
jgi:hypothetical protein